MPTLGFINNRSYQTNPSLIQDQYHNQYQTNIRIDHAVKILKPLSQTSLNNIELEFFNTGIWFFSIWDPQGTVNTYVITGLGMCTKCTEAVHAVPLLASSDGEHSAGKTSTPDPPQKDIYIYRGTENKNRLLPVGFDGERRSLWVSIQTKSQGLLMRFKWTHAHHGTGDICCAHWLADVIPLFGRCS